MRGVILLIFAVASLATGAPPNIVYLISDDQHWADFGFMGHPVVETPHLDRLAAQSAVFENGYVPASVCRPSLVTLLTGRYPHEHGIWFNHPTPGFSKLTKDPKMTKARYDSLRADGATAITEYATVPSFVGKLGYLSLQTGKHWEGHFSKTGFTHGMTLGEPSTAQNGNKTLPNGDVVAHGNGDAGLAIGRETMKPITDFLDLAVEQKKPFFLWYAPFLPHVPHDSPEKFQTLYRDRDDVPDHKVGYYAAITQFDETVGEVVREVEARGLGPNTIFVFLVDNGFEPRPEKPAQYTKRSKRAPFDDGVRTPILFRWDNQIEPGRRTGLVSSTDLFPTVVGLAELPASGTGGHDLSPVLQNETAIPDDRAVFGATYPGDQGKEKSANRDVAYRWVRQGDHKLIVPAGKNPWGDYLQKPTLFNLANDPREQTPISNPAIERRLIGLIDGWWKPRK